jgi:hypothetical protein
MKPDPITDCLLRLTNAAHLAVSALYLAARRRGPLLPSERITEAMQWQRERLFWARCYRSYMADPQALAEAQRLTPAF